MTTDRKLKPPPKRHRIHLALTAEQFEALQAVRRETGAPIAELLRRAIAAYLDAAR